MSMQSLVHVRKLNCRISANCQLDIADFSLKAGQHWCLLGGNGAGKSLLAAAVTGELVMARGHVSYQAGFDPRTDICIVSFEVQQALWQRDSRHDISEFTVSAVDQGTTVRLLVQTGRRTTDSGAGQLDQLLTQLEIADLADRGIRFLSSGQLRRAMLARALYRQPKVLILDSPLESIDRRSAAAIRQTLSAWMTPDNCMLQLSRRASDVLPGITHIALMDSLKMVDQGLSDTVCRGPAFAAFENRRPRFPVLAGHNDLAARMRQNQIAADPDMPLIVLEGVCASYGDRPVIQDLHWQMHWGDHVLIEGPNGCGKSTLLSLINGENHKAYGQPVTLFGRRRGTGESVWDIKARFGVVSNELHNRYVKGWKVLDVVVSGCFDSMGLYDNAGINELAAAREWLSVLQLDEQSGARYHELSFGQQRLVLLARAMVKTPLILILDEPCVGLDEYHRVMLLGVVDQIAGLGYTHIVYVSHSEEEIPACINSRLTCQSPASGETASTWQASRL